MPLQGNVSEVILDASEMHSAHLFGSIAAALSQGHAHFAASVTRPPLTFRLSLLLLPRLSSHFSHHHLRLDGMNPIDPYLGNGRSTTDHDGRPLRSAASEVICESTLKRAQWPFNGVQRSPSCQ